ncbi:MAG TPA: YraN family protein [bacterium]|nr:YraN family protein [bacterium]
MLAGRRRTFAQAGEDAAVEALRRRGYRVLARNVRLRRGELDVVAEEGGDLVFVEVKSRRSVAYGTPAEAVGFQKQRTLVRLAAAYLARKGLGDRACRFDVVEVRLDSAGRPVRVDVMQDAFRP